MADEKKVYDLIKQCADLSIPKEMRQVYYSQALDIVRNPKKEAKPEGFDKFWEVYPHRMAKGYAEKAFTKALKETDLETILSGLRWYCANKPKETPWAYPASWLNAKRWEDGQIKLGPKIEHQWPEWKHRLAAKITEAHVVTWFEGVEFTEGVFYVPSKFKLDWIRNNYALIMSSMFEDMEIRLK